MRGILFCVGALALFGCQSKSFDGGTLPTGGGGGPAAPKLVNELPSGPPLVTPGEHMTYRLTLKGLELAAYDITVGNATSTEDGHEVIEVQSHAKSMGLATFASKVDDYFTSWIDVKTGRSVRWLADEYASNGTDKERSEAKLAARQGDMVPMQYHLNDDPPTDEPQKVTMKDTWDYNAFLVALRAWEGAVGSKVSVEVLRSRYLWHIDMTIAKQEQVVTELGDFAALRLDATTYKLTRDGQRASGSEDRKFSIWISDDDGRVPLQINATTDYGEIEMKIVDYQPGTGTRLRP